jgi:hypothetical protein
LASLLTCRTWKDRLLGYSKAGAFPNMATWIASGNNTKMSRELIRRTVWCRLDAEVDAPWERTAFRHPRLITWTKENRGQLVWSALTLCQSWIAADRPKGTQTLGMFKGWAEVMGGILDKAGVPGLLANALMGVWLVFETLFVFDTWLPSGRGEVSHKPIPGPTAAQRLHRLPGGALERPPRHPPGPARTSMTR